jgi:hypothetical protein
MFNVKLERKLAEIGKTRHELCLTQHVEDFEHADRANFPKRSDYCERSLSYVFESKNLGLEIIISGRADSLFTFENNTEACGVLDLKRSRHFYYSKRSYERQTLEYALAVAQQHDFKHLYVIILEGPFKPSRFKYRFPRFHIINTKIDSYKIKNLHEEIETSFKEQANLLDSLSLLENTKANKKLERRGCFNLDTGLECFIKPACDAFVNYCMKERVTLRTAIENLGILSKGYVLPAL